MNEPSTPFDAQLPPPNAETETETAPQTPPAETSPAETSPAETSPAETVAPRSFFRPWMAIAGVFIVLLVAGGFWWQARERARLHEWRFGAIAMPEKIARVPEEWTAKTLSERLEKSGKVRDASAFREAAAQVNLQLVQPGAYPLPEKAGPLELARLFNQSPPLLKMTFPEGWTAERMAERMEQNGFTHARDFYRAAYPPTQAVSPWEGELFPDTYFLPRAGSAAELAAPLQARYKEVVATLPRPFPKGKDGKPLTLREVTILASLVERETSVPAERALVAGVLLNRLRKGMRLQVDATVQYARERAAARGRLETGHKERLLWRDLEIASPYNTYQNAGLPPGPICNPGEASLRAAAQPRASEYFFYVMSPQLGRHRFAKTFAEHRHNIRLAKQERAAQE